MKIKSFCLKAVERVYKKVFHKTFYSCSENTVFDRQKANDMVYEALSKGKPFMLTRYGSIEMLVTNTIRIKEEKRCYILKLWDFITDHTDMPWMHENAPLFISRNAGVFNPTPKTLEKFAHLYLEDSKIVDMVMSVDYKEKFMPLSKSCQFIHFESIYPYFVERPWTRYLKGKKVLVVHPYARSIQSQYARKEKLYENPEILPDFELITLRAIQSAAYNEVPFNTWFDALKYMEDEISKINFDVCLIGCGAYGLPLAAYVKRIGKQAIHMGGGIQLLFGIKGRRWDVEYREKSWYYNTPERINTNYYDLFNEFWINPSGDEVPEKAKAVEGACYW